jgi:serine-type D-Ala-D-Ala carboxypeptidase/endopeptidase
MNRNWTPVSHVSVKLLLLLVSLLLPVLAVGDAHGDISSNAIVSKALTDAEIKTMLRDNIDTDKEAVGLVVGIVDEHGTRVVSYGKLDNGRSADVKVK